MDMISRGFELVPLLEVMLPWIPGGILAAAVAVAQAGVVLILAALAAKVAVGLWNGSRFAAQPGQPAPPALKRRRAAPAPGQGAERLPADPIARAARTDEQSHRRRIRDRYVNVRFDGALKGTADFAVPGKVVKVARLYFEDGRGERADELLALALRHRPEESAYWLARLEILFLTGHGTRYVEVAEAYERIAPLAGEWDEIRRLGMRVAPQATIFSGHVDASGDHYGPWPTMPNWIQSSWDLTGEVIASQFHHTMRTRIGQLRESLAQGSAPETRH